MLVFSCEHRKPLVAPGSCKTVTRPLRNRTGSEADIDTEREDRMGSEADTDTEREDRTGPEDDTDTEREDRNNCVHHVDDPPNWYFA